MPVYENDMAYPNSGIEFNQNYFQGNLNALV